MDGIIAKVSDFSSVMSSLRLKFLSTNGVGASTFCGMFKFVKLRTLAAVGLGGAIGASARVGVCAVVDDGILAILACNIAGSFLLSAAVELRESVHPDFEKLVAVGFCGGLSVFAGFSRDSVSFLSADAYAPFFLNLLGNFVLCVAAVFAARALFRVFRKPALSEKIAGFFDKSDRGGRGE